MPTTTSFTVATNYSGYTVDTFWIALGQQQWGDKVSGASITFPVSFASACYTVITSYQSGGSTSSAYYGLWHVTAKTTSGCTIEDGNGCNSYLAIGKQQWGTVTTSSGGNGYAIYTFPITFNTPCAITLGNYGTSNTDYATAYSDLNVTSVRIADNSSIVPFIVIGY